MNLTHRTEPTRTGRVEGSKASLALHYTDANGKPRKKSFNAKGASVSALASNWVKLLRLAAREGFVAAAPQPDGPVRWLVFHDGPYYGEQPFALDRSRGRIWLAADEGRLLRVERDSCDEREIILGKGVQVVDLACDGEGRAWVLLSVGRTKADAPAWRRPAQGDFAHNLVRIGEGLEVELVRSVPYTSADQRLTSVHVSDGGLVLGPALEGAALLDADGVPVATWTVAPTTDNYPKGAMSPSGRWVLLTAPDGHVRLVDRDAGTERSAGGFDQVLRLDVRDDGTAYVFGHGRGDWGIYRLDEAGPTRIARDVHGQPSPDGERVAQVSEGVLELAPPSAKKAQTKAKLPVLIGRSGRAAFWDDDHLVVRMKGHTPLLEVDLPHRGSW